MDAQHEQRGGGDPVADDIESRNADTGDVVAGEQVLDEGHVAPDQDDFAADSLPSGSPEGEPDSADERLTAAEPRTDEGAPPPVEAPD
jgi:hypothetical protein